MASSWVLFVLLSLCPVLQAASVVDLATLYRFSNDLISFEFFSMRFRAFDCGSAGPVAVLRHQVGHFARLSNASPSLTTEMPRTTKRPSHTQRGATGAFTSNKPAQQSPASDTEEPDDTPPAWEDSDSEDEDYTEEWQTLPRPITYDERQETRLRQRITADEKRRKAEMRGAEQRLAGPVDNQTGERHGPYNVGGMSKRSSQGKRKQLKIPTPDGGT
ncbi:hypothetical protein C8F04DRAFT_1192775 [Mycena alexandri]|uniref:Uncharacterized protein n=1 Tax=Mycena alexandri TaxID=1745969 RepID=A0AAD6SEQ4_9AGAR|nr:hypothetical protein C8F04DRAFT_1192775 [Mycena alexandri]